MNDTLPSERRILVIDDDPAIANTFRKVLCTNPRSNSELDRLETRLFGRTPSSFPPPASAPAGLVATSTPVSSFPPSRVPYPRVPSSPPPPRVGSVPPYRRSLSPPPPPPAPPPSRSPSSVTPARATLQDFAVDSASQGEEGLELVRRMNRLGRPFAVAFVDMRMPPGWDGVETCEQLLHEDPGLEIAICSAYSDYSWHEVIARLQRPSLRMLRKPFDSRDMLELAWELSNRWLRRHGFS